jgi:hypothetical protein
MHACVRALVDEHACARCLHVGAVSRPGGAGHALLFKDHVIVATDLKVLQLYCMCAVTACVAATYGRLCCMSPACSRYANTGQHHVLQCDDAPPVESAVCCSYFAHGYAVCVSCVCGVPVQLLSVSVHSHMHSLACAGLPYNSVDL